MLTENTLACHYYETKSLRELRKLQKSPIDQALLDKWGISYQAWQREVDKAIAAVISE